MHFFPRKAGYLPFNPLVRRRETDRFLPRSLGNVFQFFVDMRLMDPLGSFRKSISSEHSFNGAGQPALADRPPSGPGRLHEIKFDGYRIIARKDGEQVRIWARTTSDYSKASTRMQTP